MEKQHLFVEINRAIGDLMMFSSEIKERETLQKISDRLDSLMDELKKVLEIK